MYQKDKDNRRKSAVKHSTKKNLTESNKQVHLLFHKERMSKKASSFRVRQGQNEKPNPIRSLANNQEQVVAKRA